MDMTIIGKIITVATTGIMVATIPEHMGVIIMGDTGVIIMEDMEAIMEVVAEAESLAVAVGEGEVAVGAPVGGPMALLPLQALLLLTPPGQPLQPVSD